MTGTAEISGKTSPREGAGVFYENSESTLFDMQGGKISNNKCTLSGIKGGAVHVAGSYAGSFLMGGTAYIPAGANGKNDVSLAGGKSIKISGTLTPPEDASDGIVATITPSDYAETVQVLSENDEGLISHNALHFALTPAGSGSWTIASVITPGYLITEIEVDGKKIRKSYC